MSYLTKTQAHDLTPDLAFVGCTKLKHQPEYRRAVEPERTNLPRLELELRACREVEVKGKVDFCRCRKEQMGASPYNS